MAHAMERASINGTQIAYQLRGNGPPIVFLHCAFLADGCRPLFEDALLGSRHALLNIHRRGYGQSARTTGPVSMADLADDVAALLAHLSIDRAHVVGHSLGGSIALELAIRSPGRVRSLCLLEPALPSLVKDPRALEAFTKVVGKAMAEFQGGRPGEAMDTWLGAVFGPGWLAIVERALPGYREAAVADAAATFLVDVPALQGWQFGPQECARVQAPALSIVQRDPTWAGFREAHQALLTCLPGARAAEMAGTTHLLHLQVPRAVAEAIGSFVEGC